MKQAIIAIEDRRFYTNAGVDLRGIGRALWQDIRAQQAVQGGSTITMQFVKNALAAQDERTLFNKLREAALAYQITRKWSKERILRNYLNTIYFGNGAYGIESAARTYFGSNHPGCGEDGKPKCAQVLAPAEAALIAGMVASPSGYDPLAQPRGRRASAARSCSQRMREQGYITPRRRSRRRSSARCRRAATSSRRVEDTAYPYFTSWVKQQVVDKLGGGQEGARKAFEGGLTVQTTLDVRLQEAAEQAVDAVAAVRRAARAPRSSRSTTDTGEVLAMVGGDDYATRAVQPRHAGPAPARLVVQAVRARPGARATASRPTRRGARARVDICVTRSKKGNCKEYFDVNNYEDAYGGVAHAAHGDDVLRQLRLRAGRHQGRHAQDRAARAPDGHPHAGLAATSR